MMANATTHTIRLSERPSFEYQSNVYSSEDLATTPTSLPRTPILTLRTIEPERLNKSADAADRVARVRWLEVVAGEHMPGEKPLHQVRIFLEESLGRLHTPTFASSSSDDLVTLAKLLQPPEDKATEPDFCITRRFSDFQRLRHALMDAVGGPHKTYCRLCGDLQAMLTFSSVRPAMSVWALLPNKTQQNVLNHLLRGVLNAYRSHLPSPSRQAARRRDACQGEHTVPVLLDEFIFGEHQADIHSSELSSPTDR